MSAQINVPKVQNYGTLDVETFDNYYSRLPANLLEMPKCVIEQWVYRHWNDFQWWLPLNPFYWKYELVDFSNQEIMKINHIEDWLETLDYWGDALFKDSIRQKSWLGNFMLEKGTIPIPIIVAINAGAIEHPHGRNHFMREPYQLIEGHMRLAYLRGMNNTKYNKLKSTHKVWLVRIPPISDKYISDIID